MAKKQKKSKDYFVKKHQEFLARLKELENDRENDALFPGGISEPSYDSDELLKNAAGAEQEEAEPELPILQRLTGKLLSGEGEKAKAGKIKPGKKHDEKNGDKAAEADDYHQEEFPWAELYQPEKPAERPRWRFRSPGRMALLVFIALVLLALIFLAVKGVIALTGGGEPLPDGQQTEQVDEQQPEQTGQSDLSFAEKVAATIAANKAVDDGRPIVALTFDDGPSPTVTDKLIDELNARGVKATFFMLGNLAEKNPALVRKAYDTGHLVCSHTYDHEDYLTDLDDEDMAKQVNKTIQVLRDITGESPVYMRPPFGAMDKETAVKIGWPMMLWTLDTRDWESRDADKIYEVTMNRITDGSVVLMHDIYESTLDGALLVVDELLKRGWRFVTLDEYYQIYDMVPQAGHVYRGTNMYL